MKITAIIPTFNREDFILRAINSIENQTIKIDEIIVVDDGSTDRTFDTVKDLDVKYIYQKNNGVSSARNKGIKAAKNKWIAFLDSDDTWNDTKIEEQIEYHKKNPNILVSHTDELWINNEKIVNQKSHQKKPNGFCFLENIPSCKIGASTLLINKDIFNSIGLFDENLKVCEDYDLWLRISIVYEIGYLNKKLTTKYAGHKNQLSFSTFAIDTYRIEALEKHINSKYKEAIKKEIIKKCKILISGAKKHNNKYILEEYENKLSLNYDS
ncbi:MAG: glycosyltransferase [Arcobacter sp.]|nr:glycosyltransferase [Arcobacter sp.]